jgi:DNA mismatch repair protein MutL
MKNKIKILPENTINQIAAGEVIERPHSVVKELVENAIDAGASKILIEIESGGKRTIRITDDGVGMTKEDLPLAIKRHATSKLPHFDLFNIQSFGFRGEALPSIASIARVKIASYPRGDGEDASSNANCITVEGGKIAGVQPAYLPNYGTMIEVKDMFFATPARLKFLKSDKAEMLAIKDVLKKLAIANPYVNFRLITEGKQAFHYTIESPKPFHTDHIAKSPIKNAGANIDNISNINSRFNNINSRANESYRKALKHRITQILGSEFMENCIPLDLERGEGFMKANLSGYICIPTYNKANSMGQFVFVNNRPVKDKLFAGAIRAAYQDFLERGRHPQLVIFICTNPSEVDVNVHPAKSEVRFRDESNIRSLIVGGVKNMLVNAKLKTSTQMASQTLKRFTTGENALNHPNNHNNYDKIEGKIDINQSNLIAKQEPVKPPELAQKSAREGQNYSFHDSISSTESGNQMPKYTDLQNFQNLPSNAMGEIDFSHLHYKKRQNHQAENGLANKGSHMGVDDYNGSDDSDIAPRIASGFAIPALGFAKTQVFTTFIISETADEIIITDQHAAHERILYEKMKNLQRQQGIKTQNLLISEVVKLNEAETAIILDNQENLAKFGIDVAKMGNIGVIVKHFPMVLKKYSIKNLLKDTAESLLSDGELLPIYDAFEDVLGNTACKNSIKAGHVMTREEMNALLRDMEALGLSASQCNHGRPTYVKISKDDMEKLFHRK